MLRVVCRGKLLAASRLTGKITQWHPFERRGTLTCNDSGTVYAVDALSFESVLPTAHRGLEGATVTFVASMEAPMKSVKSIVRSRTDAINQSNAYIRVRSDHLSSFRLQVDAAGDAATTTSTVDPAAAPAAQKKPDGQDSLPPGLFKGNVKSADGPFAIQVHVDLATVSRTYHPGTKASILDGGGVSVPVQVKDLRAVALFPKSNIRVKGSKEAERVEKCEVEERGLRPGLAAAGAEDTPARGVGGRLVLEVRGAKLQGGLVFGAKATPSGAMHVEQQVVADPPDDPSAAGEAGTEATQPRRVADPTPRRGFFLTWSSVNKAGLVLESAVEPSKELLAELTNQDIRRAAHIARGVGSFSSALPTSVQMHLRPIEFKRVFYRAEPRRRFAEEIVLLGDLKLAVDDGKRSFLVKPTSLEQKKHKQQAADRAANENLPVEPPTGKVYGVVIRWSGGQGTIETGEGHKYFIASNKSFDQLISADGHGIRGAIVTFLVDPASPKFAHTVNIISLTSLETAASKAPVAPPVPPKITPPAAAAASSDESSGSSASGTPPAGTTGSDAEEAAAAVVWVEGTIVMWMPLELQAIIQGDDSVRYVLQHADTNIVDYAAAKKQQFIARGARVKFTPFGATKRMAGNVVLTGVKADPSDVDKADVNVPIGESSGDSGAVPLQALHTDTQLWVKRLEGHGYDMSELEEFQAKSKRAINPSATNDDDDPFKKVGDPLDAIRNDPDIQRENKKFPNSDRTYFDSFMASESADTLRAVTAGSPNVRAAADKKFNALSEEQKEQAYRRAEEMMPRMRQLYQDSRDQNKSWGYGKIHFN